MNALLQDRNNISDTCIKTKLRGWRKKTELHLANGETSIAVSFTELGHLFGGDVWKGLRLLMRGEGFHKPIFALDFVRIRSLLIYTDIVKYNIVGDTKAPLLCWFLFISKLKIVIQELPDNTWPIKPLATFSLDDCWKTLSSAYTLVCKTLLMRFFLLYQWE